MPVAPAATCRAGEQHPSNRLGRPPHGCGSQVPKSNGLNANPLPRAPHLIHPPSRHRRAPTPPRPEQPAACRCVPARGHTHRGRTLPGNRCRRTAPAAPHPSTRSRPGGVPGTGVIPRRRDLLDIADASDQHRIARSAQARGHAAVPQSAAVGRTPAQQAALPGHGAGVNEPHRHLRDVGQLLNAHRARVTGVVALQVRGAA